MDPNDTRKTADNAAVRKKKIGIKKKSVFLAVAVGIIVFVAALLAAGSLGGRGDDPDPGVPVLLPEDDSMSFEFNLTASGKHSVTVAPGDTVTVLFRLYRTDTDADFSVYAVQNEIEFDTGVFELVEDSISCRYTVSVHSYEDGRCRIYMNTFSTSPSGFVYTQGAEFGSFTLRVKDDVPPGTYQIASMNYKMSASGGRALYASTSKDVEVEVKSINN
ncbi:MAG: hypothetical protein IKD81_03375 [Eubacteriaceae bacterium]|nr:hypothetical protein [Eubacteriaceae bacterium]